MVRQAVSLQPMEDDGKQISTCSPWKTPHQSRWMHLKEAVTLWEAHAGAGFWQDLWPHGERSPRWSRFAGRTCDPVGDPWWSSLFLKDCTPWKGLMLEQFMKNCSLWEGLMLEKFMEDCLLWEGPHTGAREEREESSPEEEGAADTTCDELMAASIPLCSWRGVRENLE
ncbi:EH domain-containing protein 4 [Grus japonensis]|uniref:EH domain-containing protein 4 n=1 Tax=Grus japonensis TaxID=30415 RepID=A0ABC9WEY2_GRUJA